MTDECYALQAVTNATESKEGGAYFLFPHKKLKNVFKLPPYCCFNDFAISESKKTENLSIGHPSTKPDYWNVGKGAKKGAKVLLFQGGNPTWRNGLWGEGKLDSECRNAVAKVTVTKLLQFPLVVPKSFEHVCWSKDVVRLWLGLRPKSKKLKSYQGSFVTINSADYDKLSTLPQFKSPGRKIPESTTEETHVRRFDRHPKENFARSFEREMENEGFKLDCSGWPDYLVESPSGDVWAYEIKRDEKDLTKEPQNRAHVWLKKCGIPVYVVFEKSHQEGEFRKRLEHRRLTVVTFRRGWPDFRLKDSNIAVELKTNNDSLKEIQVRVNSTLGRKGVNIRVVRGIEEDGGWTVWDDTERWL